MCVKHTCFHSTGGAGRFWNGKVAVWPVQLGGYGRVCIAGGTAAQGEGEFAFPGLSEVQGFGPSHRANTWRVGSFHTKSLLLHQCWFPCGGDCQGPVLGVVLLAYCFSGCSLMLKGLAYTVTEEEPKQEHWEAPLKLLKQRHTQEHRPCCLTQCGTPSPSCSLWGRMGPASG